MIETKKILTVSKIAVKNMFSDMVSEKKGKIQKWILLIIPVSFLPISFLLWMLSSAIYAGLEMIGTQNLFPAMAVGFASLFIFFIGIMFIVSVLYYAKDIQQLLYMPVKCSSILTGRFVPMLLYEYITCAVLLLPMLIFYGYISAASFVYYLIMTVIFLLTPILPLSLASLLVMLMMRFTSFFKNRDILAKFGGVALLVGAVFLNYKMTGITEEALSAQSAQNISNLATGVINRIFFNAPFAGLALAPSTVLQRFEGLLGFAGLSALGFTVYLLVGKLLYLKGLAGINNTVSKKEKLTYTQFSHELKHAPIAWSIAKKDFKLMFRSPVYFMNNIIAAYIMPILMFIPAIGQAGQLSTVVNSLGLGFIEPGTTEFSLIFVICVSACAFFSAVNGIAASAVSREGECFYIMKLVPASFKMQALGKIIPGIIIGMSSFGLTLAVAFILLGIPAQILIYILLTSICVCVMINLIGFVIDMNAPKLHWQDEAKAVKQNMNVVFELLISMAVIGFMIGLNMVIGNFYLIFTVSTLIFILISVIIWRIIGRSEQRVFNKMN